MLLVLVLLVLVLLQAVAEVLMRADRMTLAELTRLVQRDQGIMGVSRAGKTKVKVTSANVREREYWV